MNAAFPETIPALLSSRACRPGPWLAFEGDTWSVVDVLAEVDRMAVGLAARGVRAGDVVAIACGNRPETIFAWFAANRLGAAAMPMNPAYKRPEIEGVFAVAKPRVVVATDDFRGVFPTSAAIASPDELRSMGAGSPEATVAPDDIAVLIATSGTTGRPKLVMQTHRTYALTAEAFPWWIGIDEHDAVLCTLPLFHINAQAYSTIAALGAGARLALVPKFSASRFWQDVKCHRATQVNVIGAMIHILLSTPPSPDDRGHGLRICYSALALTEERHRAFEDRFGVRLTVGYGLSETTFGTAWGGEGSREPAYGTMGVLRQHPRLGTINEARVVADDGSEADTGELWLKNPAMMRGYMGDEEATRAAFEDGWFKTGDLVRRDGRCFTFVARKKEVLRRRGENVAAVEIEQALAAHPAVGEAAVIGVPSPLGEDEIVAFVTLKAPTSDAPAALQAFVRERLADFKVPQRIHVLHALPRTATERIAKHLLREPEAEDGKRGT